MPHTVLSRLAFFRYEQSSTNLSHAACPLKGRLWPPERCKVQPFSIVKNHRGLSGVASDTAAFPTLKEAGLKTFHGFLRAIFDREILAFNEAKATGHATLA